MVKKFEEEAYLTIHNRLDTTLEDVNSFVNRKFYVYKGFSSLKKI